MAERAVKFSVSPASISKQAALRKKRNHPQDNSLKKISRLEVPAYPTPPSSPEHELVVTPVGKHTNTQIKSMFSNLHNMAFFMYHIGASPHNCWIDMIKAGLRMLDFYVQRALQVLLQHSPQLSSMFFGPQTTVFVSYTSDRVMYVPLLRFVQKSFRGDITNHHVDLIRQAETDYLTDSGIITRNPNQALDILIGSLRHEVRTFLVGSELADRNTGSHFFTDILIRVAPTAPPIHGAYPQLNNAFTDPAMFVYNVGTRYMAMRSLFDLVRAHRMPPHYQILFYGAFYLVENLLKANVSASFSFSVDGLPPVRLICGPHDANIVEYQLTRGAATQFQLFDHQDASGTKRLPWEEED